MGTVYRWISLFSFSSSSFFVSINGGSAFRFFRNPNSRNVSLITITSTAKEKSSLTWPFLVPSGSIRGEASIVAEVVEVEENSTEKMQTLRTLPLITITKTAAYALYELTYIRDVPYKPQEFYVQTHKFEPDADAKVVQICERLYDSSGRVIEHTQLIRFCKGKPNTAHCLRFPGDWFHVFGIGRRSIGFTVRIEVKSHSKISEVIIGPENRTATSDDVFLRVNLVGDFAGYTNMPSFEDRQLYQLLESPSP